MLVSLFTLTAGLFATAFAFDCHGPYFSFYNRPGKALSYDLLDPAIFPGTSSPHLHSFDGGNGLAADMDFDTTQSSSCTTARLKPDKSLYWRPTLFWNGNNTGLYRVPDKFLKIYYKFGDAGNVRANVTEYPENHRMLAGYPAQRSLSANPGGLKWACLGENYKRIDSPDGSFPKGFTSCKEGLTAEITFPACWNGQSINPKSPHDHMAYPTNQGMSLEACPKTHRVARFPSIFIEFWYDVSAFDDRYRADQVPWVLANGDPTGYGFHADFLNGWQKGVLAKATAEAGFCNCGCGCGHDEMKQCFGADNVNDEGNWNSCTAGPVYAPDTSAPVDALPGCNPIQAGPAAATPVTGEGCAVMPANGAGPSDVKASSPVGSASRAAAFSVAFSTSKPVVTNGHYASASPSRSFDTMRHGNPANAYAMPTSILVPTSEEPNPIITLPSLLVETVTVPTGGVEYGRKKHTGGHRHHRRF
ncbi:hypothetical protein BDV95DRAFT_490444 [Massariosphaeria phaeospora]|uniref:DUF1996 domain-containing protein n=1 Tax=Massariosphaeria phaeospora TaxID=100035 RepID=A0A7C8MMU3_9PLEO|nr:hypothetical protein BDV95DRAFT_490444 [Massariosphaeria phaeospora]